MMRKEHDKIRELTKQVAELKRMFQETTITNLAPVATEKRENLPTINKTTPPMEKKKEESLDTLQEGVSERLMDVQANWLSDTGRVTDESSWYTRVRFLFLDIPLWIGKVNQK